MNILFTGASSFTGYWFINELAARGHTMTAVFTGSRESYASVALRNERVSRLGKICTAVFETSFGSSRFFDLLANQTFDLFCHHAAAVAGYKSPDFDIQAAVTANTFQCRAVLQKLSTKGCARVLLTGSVFEGGEGAGSQGLPHFSAYGLSKSLTAQVFAHYAAEAGMQLNRFVIPNPFGAFEEKRFVHYLFNQWLNKLTPAVNTPLYVRDNIHVQLLAQYYAHYAAQQPRTGNEKFAPYGYIESQGAFVQRLAAEMKERLQLPCAFTLNRQQQFNEPFFRTNTDYLPEIASVFNETAAWDSLAEYYLHTATSF